METQGINYQLAKRLKDAGFPQELKEGDWVQGIANKEPYLLYYEEPVLHPFAPSGIGTASGSISRTNAVKDELEIYKIPTLSELIEACGDKFEELHRFEEGDLVIGKEKLKAPYYGCINYDEIIDDEIVSTFGKTPEEAVAKLWIKLN